MANSFQSLFQYGQEWSGRLVDLLGQLSDASVPAGGTSAQVLAKASNADYDTGWVDAGGGSSPVLYADKDLTSAQLLALHDTAVKLIDGVVGKAILVTAWSVTYRAGATPYTDHGGSLQLFIDFNGFGASVTSMGLATVGLWDQPVDALYPDNPAGLGGYGTQTPVSHVSGKELDLWQDTANPTGGDGTLTVEVWYVLIDA